MSNDKPIDASSYYDAMQAQIHAQMNAANQQMSLSNMASAQQQIANSQLSNATAQLNAMVGKAQTNRGFKTKEGTPLIDDL